LLDEYNKQTNGELWNLSENQLSQITRNHGIQMKIKMGLSFQFRLFSKIKNTTTSNN
jgi:hypothetical protein